MIHISLAGKGSSGKSTLVPFLVERLATPGTRLLVVDADPHQTAARLLGISPGETLGSLRSRYERQFKSGNGLAPDESREAFAERAMGAQALVHVENGPPAPYDFLPMGHWEPGGSQCTVNRVLDRALSALASRYDVLLVDNEAGIEHLGRFALPIDLLLILATPDPLFLDVAARIWQRCREVNRPVREVRLVLNRADAADRQDPLLAAWSRNAGLPIIAWLPESAPLRQLSRAARSPLDLPADDPWRRALNPLLDSLPTFIHHLEEDAHERFSPR